LPRIFDPKKKEGTQKRRNVHDEDFHDVCSSPNGMKLMKSRRGDAHRMWYTRGMRDACNIFGRTREGKRSLGRPFGNERVILNGVAETLYEGVDWTHRVEDRDQWRVLVNILLM
jgi:hypothetical protein